MWTSLTAIAPQVQPCYKVDPALYHLAIERLSVEPCEAIAIEDSRNGMLAAKRAGLRCVVAPNPITAGQDFSEADWVLETLDGLTLGELMGRN